MFNRIKNWFNSMIVKPASLVERLVSLAIEQDKPELMPVIAGSANDFASLQNDAVTYIAEKTLRIAHRILRFYDLADKAKLPSQNSKTFQYTRYERLPLPTATLADGITGNETNMTITTVTAVAEQWGAYIIITDVAELTIRHKPLQKGIQLLGYQSGETIEREIFNVVVTGTTIFYPGTVTTRDALTSTDVVTADTWRKMVASLRSNGAMGMEKAAGSEDPELGDHYVAVVDPFMEQDIASDPDFIDAVRYAAAKRLWNGEVGTFLGTRFVRSNSLPTISSAAAPSVAVNEGGGDIPASSRFGRVLVVGFDTLFNYPTRVYQAATYDVGAADVDDSITVTLPNDSNFRYKIYVSSDTSAPTASATKFVQGNDQYFSAAQTIEIGDSGNANGVTIFALSTSGTSAGSVLDELAGTSSKVHLGFLFGKEAYTVVDLQNLQSTLTPPGPSDSDPLGQRRKAGWKLMFKAVVNNNQFYSRVEAESNFD